LPKKNKSKDSNQQEDFILKSLFEAIIFLSQQGIDFQKRNSPNNQDNFKALLKYKINDVSFIESDIYLRRKFNDVQNEMIQILHDQMRDQIIQGFKFDSFNIFEY